MLTEFENNRESLMVVMAGYKEKMDDMMRLDQGLDRRFPHRLHLEDYTCDELAQIASYMAKEKGKIAEQGTHKELLQKNGLYAEMWMRQQEQSD